MKIGLVGSHGTGKSTLSYLLAGELQKRDYSVGLILETVRECPFPINEDSPLEAQLWMA